MVMRNMLFFTAFLSLFLSIVSCSKSEEIQEPPHYDCFGDQILPFPFLESEVGTLGQGGEGIYYSAVFYDDGTFEINYSGRCNVDTSSAYCQKQDGKLIDLDLEITGTWIYNQSVDIERVLKDVCVWTCHKELDYTYTQLNGASTLTILHSTIPEFEGMTIQGFYAVNCYVWSFIIFIPDKPMIGLFFNGEYYLFK
jgi:hypothetical protein